MNWFKKVKQWFVGLFKKEKIQEETVVSVPKVEVEKPLNKVVRERLALSPEDLLPKRAEKPVPVKCSHAYELERQVWVKVAQKKFELQNSVVCVACNERKIIPIA